MILKNRKKCLGLFLSLMFFSPYLFASECTIDSNTMDRGEEKAFIICGKNISPGYILKGLSEAGIKTEYEQYLKMCNIGQGKPGIYLILRAENDATTATISIFNSDGNESVCEGLNIAVKNRVPIPEASLQEPPEPNLPFKILTIKGDKSLDLSKACIEGLAFPKGKWPSLSLLSSDDTKGISPEVKARYLVDQPIICTKTSIRALVKVQGQQRYPAKVVISKLVTKGGEERQGVAYAMLPSPVWASSMRDEDAEYIDVAGIRTRYFEKGDGDALLLIHGGQAGGTSNALSWQQNFDNLAKYFHVYAIDRLGQGYTDNPKTDQDYEEYYTKVVDHVYGFIKAVGIEKVHLVGQSQGGWPVTRIALDHPEIVKSLVNMDSGMAPDDPLARTMPFMMYIMFYADPREGATKESIHRGMELWSYSMNNITDDGVQKKLKITRLPKIIEARKQMIKHKMNPAHNSFRALKKKAIEEIKAGNLKVPSLVLWGYNDPSMHYEGGIELFKLISSGTTDSRLHIFNNCGHSPYIEYPELFNRLIISFCGATY